MLRPPENRRSFFGSTGYRHAINPWQFELQIVEHLAIGRFAASKAAVLCHLNFRRRSIGRDFPDFTSPRAVRYKVDPLSIAGPVGRGIVAGISGHTLGSASFHGDYI